MSAISFVEYEITEGEVVDSGQLWGQGWGRSDNHLGIKWNKARRN
jgi:hypothetical protein